MRIRKTKGPGSLFFSFFNIVKQLFTLFFNFTGNKSRILMETTKVYLGVLYLEPGLSSLILDYVLIELKWTVGSSWSYTTSSTKCLYLAVLQ